MSVPQDPSRARSSIPYASTGHRIVASTGHPFTGYCLVSNSPCLYRTSPMPVLDIASHRIAHYPSTAPDIA
eukprot:1860730-Rhodomonas_salina.1